MDASPSLQAAYDSLKQAYQALELDLRETYDKVRSLQDEIIAEQKRRKQALKKQKDLQLENAKLRQIIDRLEGRGPPADGVTQHTTVVAGQSPVSLLPPAGVAADDGSAAAMKKSGKSSKPPTAPRKLKSSAPAAPVSTTVATAPAAPLLSTSAPASSPVSLTLNTGLSDGEKDTSGSLPPPLGAVDVASPAAATATPLDDATTHTDAQVTPGAGAAGMSVPGLRAQSSPNVLTKSLAPPATGAPSTSGAFVASFGTTTSSSPPLSNASMSSSPSGSLANSGGGVGGLATTWKRVRMTNPNDRGLQGPGSVSSGSPPSFGSSIAMGDRASLMLSAGSSSNGGNSINTNSSNGTVPRPAGPPPTLPPPSSSQSPSQFASDLTHTHTHTGAGSGSPRPVPPRPISMVLPSPRAMLPVQQQQQQQQQEERQTTLTELQHLLYVASAKGDLSPVEAAAEAGSGTILFLTDGQLRAATLDNLIYLLPCNSDPYYLIHFLITFRSFCAPEELLNKLVDVWDKSASATYTTRELEVFRIKFMNVVKTWLDKHFYDFTPELIERVMQFLDEHQEAIGPVTCHSLKKLIKRHMERIEKRVVYSVAPTLAPILPPDIATCELGPLAVDPLELARQMTLRDEQQYKAILPRECMNQCWNKGMPVEQSERAPHVVRIILRFNAVSAWVTRCIVSEPVLKKRNKILTRMIKLGHHLRQIHNYHSLLAVIAALESASVTRLKKTWEAVDKSYMQQLGELKALMSAEGSYKNFRAALHSEDPPCIPYMGVYLADLTFIEDGNPDKITSTPEDVRHPAVELINFAKMRMLAKVIDEIRFYQQDPFAFEPVPRIQEYLAAEETNPLSEKDAYELSLKAEPRQAK